MFTSLEKPICIMDDEDLEPMEPITFKITERHQNGLFQQPRFLEYISETEKSSFFSKDITYEKIEDRILYKRKKFETLLLERNGPPIIPTMFKNGEGRFEFVRQQMKERSHLESPANPPKQPFYISSFAEDVFMNLHFNFRVDPKVTINHGLCTKIIPLRDNTCGELAFIEMLMPKPRFYSKDWNEVKKCKYIDPNQNNWVPLVAGLTCPNPRSSGYCQFVADFSMILPEEEVSTVMVSCTFCGWLTETVLCDNTIKLVKNDIQHNIAQRNSDNKSENLRYVISLPLRSSYIDSCSFVEGLMGVTTIKSKKYPNSILVRTRLYYTCTLTAVVNTVLHDALDPVKCNFLAEVTDMLVTFGINDIS